MLDRLEDRNLGETPEFELQLIPSWLVFSADTNYIDDQFACFKIRNNNPVPIVYRLRTKERCFPRFSSCHGYLEAHGEEEICVTIPSALDWPRDPVEYAGRRHKVVVENLVVSGRTLKPKSKREAYGVSILIFRATPPFIRMYTKLNIILPKVAKERFFLEPLP
ncbi:unnamed protein product [Thelazia callipaeda]|uniref:MSP domain-containing protein n=1 Tax=Thelazia callipaeda TaxID=103827 RepID=A0A0N5D2F5_THECL|nr:unnamed protein product [Thelazia callipaeda]